MTSIRQESRSSPTWTGTKGETLETGEALAAARRREAVLQRALEQVEALGVHEDGEEPVGDLGRGAHPRPGVNAPVKIFSPGFACRMLLSGRPSPVVPGPVAGMA